MFAIVDIAGFQEKVEKGMKLQVPALHKEEGETVTFTQVLLISSGKDDAKVGTPYVEGASVEAKVLSNGRSDKLLVFKMKQRKRYRRTKGHRQDFTEVEITKIQG